MSLAPANPAHPTLLDAFLKREVTSSFSDLWYRVGPTRPALSPHTQVTRQRFGGRTSYIVEDPAGGQFYRLGEAAYVFVGLLDGNRTVDDAWQTCNAQLGDDAPTQRECIELLARLQLFGLLTGQQPLSADMIERRRRDVADRRLRRRTGGWMSPTIPILNPERWLEATAHLLRPIFSRAGLVIWGALIGVALYRIFVRRADLVSQFNGVLSPDNLLWLGLIFILLRAWHELGHACAVKAMGGRCTEIGLLFVVYLFPFPYCDTSSAWRFPEVHKRVVVSAGGMLFETFVAAIAAILWSFGDETDAGLARTMLYNIMVLSGITTLIFNLNPLLRYDGYYILSDLTGIANLAQRASELWGFVVRKLVFRVQGLRAPSVRSTGELWTLLAYGALSTPYRLIVLFGIILVIWSNPAYLTLGAVLALVATLVWIVWPLLKGVAWLAASPQLLGRRVRATGIIAGVALALTVLLGVVPFPAAAYAPGLIIPQNEEPIRALEDGFVERIAVEPGTQVEPNDTLLVLRHPEIEAAAEVARATLARAEANLAAAAAATRADQLQAELNLAQARRDLANAERRVAALTMRAGIKGRVVPAAGLGGSFAGLEGTFVRKGELIGSVATTDSLIVETIVPDRDHAYIFRVPAGQEMSATDVHVSVRARGKSWQELPAALLRVPPTGSRRVGHTPHAAQVGGDLVMDPTDPRGEQALAPQFVVEIAPTVPVEGWQPGLRARVRFGVPAEPLLDQWWRRFRQYLSDRVSA